MIGDLPIGALVTRIEIEEELKADNKENIYILHVMMILVLEKYRKLKIGSFLMDWILNKKNSFPVPISKMSLHVLKSN